MKLREDIAVAIIVSVIVFFLSSRVRALVQKVE